jgi:hypothetical protein
MINIAAEIRSIDRALKRMLAKAKTAGIAKPSIFFESAGRVYVMDDDHRGQILSDKLSAGGRQEAIVAEGFLETPHDVGAW